MSIFKRKEKEAVPPQKPELTGFDKGVIAISAGTLLGGLAFGGILVSGAMMVGLGVVMSTAVLFYKFPGIKRFIMKFNKFVDLIVFIGGFALAQGTFGYITATFTGIYVTAYLSLNDYWEKKKIYNNYQKA